MTSTDFSLTTDNITLKARWLKHQPQTAERPVLVFLHDSLGCIFLWRDFPAQVALASGHDVLIYERRGYGHSDPISGQPRSIHYQEEEAAVLKSVLDECGIRQAVLWGFSDGGSIALIAAAQYPDRIKGIVTQGAHVFVEDITLRGIQTAIDHYKTTNLRERLSRYHGANTDGLFNAWTQTWFRDAFRKWNITPLLPQVSCPSLILQGVNDEFGTAAQVYAIRDHVSGPCTTILVNNATHAVHKEQPEHTLRWTLGFLYSLN